MPNERAPVPSRGGYRALAGNSGYLTLAASTALIHFSHSLHMTILPWLVLDVTGSKSSIGWATTATFLPYALLSIPAGIMVDRHDLRRVMIASMLACSLAAAAIPILYAAGVLAGWHVLLLVFLLFSVNTPSYLARSALLPRIVPQENIITANSATAVLIGLAMMLGSAVVGPVVEAVGLANGFAVCAGALALAALIVSQLEVPADADQDEASRHPGWRDLSQGIAYAWREPVVRTVFMLDALYFLFAHGSLQTGKPLFVKDVLGAGPQVHSFLQVAFNAGMLLGALWLGQIGSHLHKGRVIVLCWLGYGLSQLSYPLFRTLGPALVASFLVGMIGNVIPTCAASLLQERVPQKLLGRVFGVWNTLAPGSGFLSGAIAGALAGVLPATGLIALSAAISCGNSLLGRVSALWRTE